MVLSALFFAFLAFLCFFDVLVVPVVSDLVSVLAEVPVSVEVLPCANAPNEARQSASATAIVRIMVISLGNSEWTRPSGLALRRASSVPPGSRRISPAEKKRPRSRTPRGLEAPVTGADWLLRASGGRAPRPRRPPSGLSSGPLCP